MNKDSLLDIKFDIDDALQTLDADWSIADRFYERITLAVDELYKCTDGGGDSHYARRRIIEALEYLRVRDEKTEVAAKRLAELLRHANVTLAELGAGDE